MKVRRGKSPLTAALAIDDSGTFSLSGLFYLRGRLNREMWRGGYPEHRPRERAASLFGAISTVRNTCVSKTWLST